ncbi:MaoC family dehydratase [Hansschlegelia plantiphila]|uniref:Beta-methylmalyl-CoA dehydratase n=1 Tax=Hansschlegelia plantiphila TaxID=374655 RepID=A0A9W6MWB0_9HYPH|nr:MaoC family dehydratase [Hansschlegelia plantiphila]GLK68637.1 beta-methylmalyl-CoA dehydratase [Hansschlegelia plantiphila]
MAGAGRFFEDFVVGDVIRHATPRTVTVGDLALNQALYGNRFVVQSSDAFARRIGYPASPVDDLVTFHVVFGKTVPDVSLNAFANLGYADGRFLRAVYPGDTLVSTSEVIGVRPTSKGDAGVVWVRTRGVRSDGAPVLEYVRWVLVRVQGGRPVPDAVVPELPSAVDPSQLGAACPRIQPSAWDDAEAGGARRFDDYAVGEKIDHVDGMTVEEAEHQLATRLWQNTARVHFDGYAQKSSKIGRRLVYGGHVISLARGLTFNGLENAFHIAGINAGRHVAPIFAGDTLYAWSEIVDKQALPGRDDVGALRVRITGLKDFSAADFPRLGEDGKDHPAVVLDLDLWLLVPR